MRFTVRKWFKSKHASSSASQKIINNYLNQTTSLELIGFFEAEEDACLDLNHFLTVDAMFKVHLISC